MTTQAKPATAGKVAKLEREKGESLWVDAWKRLRRNRAALMGFMIIIVSILIALFAPLIAPRPYTQQVLAENNSAPEWIINMFPVMKAADFTLSLTPPTEWTIVVENGQEVQNGDVLATRADGTTRTSIMDGVAYLVNANTVAVTKAQIRFYDITEDWEVLMTDLDMMRPVDPGVVIAQRRDGSEVIQTEFRSRINFSNGVLRVQEQDGGYVRINNDYPLGADVLGRDLLSRILYGARVSLAVAFVGPVVAMFLGITTGLLSGYAGGWIDNLLMRIVDIMYAFPTILLIILLMAFFRLGAAEAEPGSIRFILNRWDAALGGMLFIFIGIGATAWMSLARLTRGQVLSVREKEYIEAARSIGTDDFTIIRTHILPNILGPIVVAETLTIPTYISYEAFLSFIGLGVQAPTPSWGAMIAEGATAIGTYPNQAIFPALALFFVMFAFNFLGDGLRDALDPRMRGVD